MSGLLGHFGLLTKINSGGSLPAFSLLSTGSAPDVVLSKSNYTFTSGPNSSANWHKAKGNITKTADSAGFYFETKIDVVNSGATAIGVALAGTDTSSASGGINNAGDGDRYQYFDSGQKRSGGVYSSYGASFTTNDVIGVSIKLVTGSIKIHFYKNGADQGEAFSISSVSLEPHFCSYGNSSIVICQLTIPNSILYLPSGFAIWT